MRKLETSVENAVRQFAHLISDRYEIEQVIVYGSRARGDYREDSDIDVAVLLRGEPQRGLPVMNDMSRTAFDILVETGLHISPFPIWIGEWLHPERYSNPAILENIDKEGIRL